MKFASLNSGRDGIALLVSRNLQKATRLHNHDLPINLQSILDDWQTYFDKLENIYQQLNDNNLPTDIIEDFDQTKCASPLPRAYQWCDGSAYVNHVELVRKARGATMPESFWSEPLMYQGGSDSFLCPHGDIVMANDQEYGIDLEGEVAIITDDVKMAAKPEETLTKILLVMLVNDVSLRGLIPAELAKGFGFFQAKPSSAFSPIAVTLDELEDHYKDGKIHLPLLVNINDQPFGKANAGVDMTFDFGKLTSHAALTRPLSAGTIIGSGTVSNKLDNGPGKAIADGGVGYSCLAEIRMIETINDGSPSTSFLKFGDCVKIWMEDEKGNSIFGEINQKVKKYNKKI